MHFLDTPWVLWGIIIALSSGYAISLVVALVYGCVKCSKFIQDKNNTIQEPKERRLRTTSHATKTVTAKPSTTSSLSIFS